MSKKTKINSSRFGGGSDIKLGLYHNRFMDYVCPVCLNTCRIYLNGNISFLVSKSNTIVNRFEYKFQCTCPECDVYMFDCDPEISVYIKQLQKKGYMTKFCCQGHEYKDIYNVVDRREAEYSFPYVMIETFHENTSEVLNDIEKAVESAKKALNLPQIQFDRDTGSINYDLTYNGIKGISNIFNTNRFVDFLKLFCNKLPIVTDHTYLMCKHIQTIKEYYDEYFNKFENKYIFMSSGNNEVFVADDLETVRSVFDRMKKNDKGEFFDKPLHVYLINSEDDIQWVYGYFNYN